MCTESVKSNTSEATRLCSRRFKCLCCIFTNLFTLVFQINAELIYDDDDDDGCFFSHITSLYLSSKSYHLYTVHLKNASKVLIILMTWLYTAQRYRSKTSDTKAKKKAHKDAFIDMNLRTVVPL